MTSKILLGHIGNLQEQLAEAKGGAAVGEPSEMVERVARAICEADESGLTCVMASEPDREPCTDANCRRFDQARAAITAMREPTEAMLDAAGPVVGADRDVWRAMIDAALGK